MADNNDTKALFRLVEGIRRDLSKEKEARRKSDIEATKTLTEIKSDVKIHKEKFADVNKRFDKLENSVDVLNNTVSAMVNQFKGVKYALIALSGIFAAFMLYGTKIQQVMRALTG